MYTAKIQNSSGALLNLTQNESAYQVTSITGLTSAGATVNVTSLAGIAGGVFNSSHVNTRNIVITLSLCGDIEANRLQLYNYCPEGEKVRLIYSNSIVGEVYIDGYVDKMECPQFVQNEVAQISIICDYPYFQSTTPSSVSTGASISFNNPSTVSSGAIFRVSILQSVSSFEITDGSGNSLKFAHPNVSLFFTQGSTININTQQANKSATITRSGVTSNIIGYLVQGSTFFQIVPGQNSFDVTDPNSYRVGLFYNKTFRGV